MEAVIFTRRRLCCVSVAAFLAVPLALQAAETKEVRLTILHTNDTHGHLLPFSYPSRFNPDSSLRYYKQLRDIGGAARRATLVKRIRCEPNRTVLLVDAGDLCDGTPFSTEFHGDADIAAMNAIGYDLGCPGNHEFSNPFSQVKKMMADAKFPLVCANAREKASGKTIYPPFIIKNIQGARIAFFGLITESTQTYPGARNDAIIDDPIATARKLVPQLRRDSDLVVAINHIGIEEDRRLATAVNGIDVIVSGHSHTLLPSPIFIGQVPSGNSKSINGTIIVQNHQWGGTLGRLDLLIHKSVTGAWSVVRYFGKLLPITAAIPDDPRTAETLRGYWGQIAGKYGEVLGVATEDFCEYRDDYAENNFVADAVRDAMKTEVHLENMGGVRAPLLKGPITYGDMVTLDPFGNTVVTFSIIGRDLARLVERTRPAVSGIRYEMEAGKLKSIRVNGAAVEEQRVYRASTNSYFADRFLAGVSSKVDTKKPRLDLLIEHVKRNRPLAPSYDGRRILRGMPSFGS